MHVRVLVLISSFVDYFIPYFLNKALIESLHLNLEIYKMFSNVLKK